MGTTSLGHFKFILGATRFFNNRLFIWPGSWPCSSARGLGQIYPAGCVDAPYAIKVFPPFPTPLLAPPGVRRASRRDRCESSRYYVYPGHLSTFGRHLCRKRGSQVGTVGTADWHWGKVLGVGIYAAVYGFSWCDGVPWSFSILELHNPPKVQGRIDLRECDCIVRAQ